jgi:hypothetical protein
MKTKPAKSNMTGRFVAAKSRRMAAEAVRTVKLAPREGRVVTRAVAEEAVSEVNRKRKAAA